MTHKRSQGSETGEPSSDALWIVGIGASAGGLEAFEHFFTNMPPDTTMAFVVVQHLDPNRKSMLVELLQRYTRMKVSQVIDKTKVEANQIYIIPPNRDMRLEDNVLHLIEPIGPRASRLAVDFFFRSLAEDQREKAIGVILSGTGADGTLGLQAIKGEGGMVMVQSPESSRYSGMPTNAINTSLVDFILPPEEMPQQLLRYIKHAHLRPLGVDAGEDTEADRDSALHNIFVLLRAYTGHDFSLYKMNTVRRRIERRMVVNQIQAIKDYADYLQQNNKEVGALFKELLIGVTNFFRDQEAFARLEQIITSDIVPNAEIVQPIRVWVPACSSGEEAYSIAILFQERLKQLQIKRKLQIFATDIDTQSIEKARLGIYPANISADISPERLKLYFTKEGNSYRVNKLLRDSMVFSVHNIIHDPPFSRLDLISCRNLLIYMRPSLQAKMYPLFHYALSKHGFLFLGNSESLGDFSHLFDVIDKKWKIFRATENFIANDLIANFTAMSPKTKIFAPLDIPIKQNILHPREAVERMMLDLHTPPALVVNERGEVIYIHGRTGKYLELAPGEANFDIFRLARQSLRIPLTSAIRRAQAKKQPVVYENVSVEFNGDEEKLKLTITPISKPASMTGLMLIVFEPYHPQTVGSYAPAVDTDKDVLDTRDQRITELSQELAATKQYLQSTIEELETSNEELTATNEELQSSNEELQSTNEELQTAKEELQSINEELVTVNTELEAKIDELSVVNDDMHNLFIGVNLGAILLDLDLYIRRFTPAAKQVVNLIDADLNRPFSHTVCNLLDVDLVALCVTVLDTLETHVQDVQHKNGEWYWMQIRPYRTTGNQIRGVTLTFTSIDRIKQVEKQLRQRDNDLRHILRISDTVLFEQDLNLRYVNVINLSPEFGEAETILGKHDNDLFSPEDAATLTKIKDSVIQSGKTRNEVVNVTINGNTTHYQMFMEAQKDDQDKITGLICAATNITTLQNTLNYFNYVLDMMHVGFYVHSVPLDDTTYHSPSWAALLGYDLAELPAPNERLTWVYAQTHPDDIKALGQAYNDFIEGNSETYQVECRLKHKSGEWIWVSGKSEALVRDPQGRVLRLMGTMTLIEK
ncbi:MAG: PAS domain-containing protein [Anaerolineales bacterium]|nr:PAS domain-containing protein [Anaerolineales bacterium]